MSSVALSKRADGSAGDDIPLVPVDGAKYHDGSGRAVNESVDRAGGLRQQETSSSRSGSSTGSTVPEYRAETKRPGVGVTGSNDQGGGPRQRLPYHTSSSSGEEVTGEHDSARMHSSGTGNHDGKAPHGHTLLTGAHRKDLKRRGWVSRPTGKDEAEWLDERDEVTEWLPLFYDLVVVAVLGTFTLQHEVSTPPAIPVFLSFFTIIFWTWCSQTAYDMRFQSNDAMHRFFKFLQVCLFLYQGASSGNWNPGRIEVWNDAQDSGDYGARLAMHQDALRSWLTVVVAFAVSRGILMLQYAICAWQGRKVGRDVRHVYMTMGALLISLILAIVSAGLPSASYQGKVAKITVFYLAIIVELADGWFQVLLRLSPAIPTRKIGERYGAFLLIVIGEGIIMISKAFNKAISGLSDDDTGTYVQVFLCIVVVYLLWSFLFSNFDKDDDTGSGRVAIWQTLHFPLTFGVLLLMSGMVNVVIITSSSHGLSLVLEELGNLAMEVNDTGTLPVEEIKRANRYMYKLNLEPSFPTMMENIAGLAAQQNETNDYYIVLDQYLAQIVYSAFDKYGVEIPDSAEQIYTEIYATNTTWIADETSRNETRQRADEMLTEFTGDIIVDAFTGILWLLPVSGIVLILSALRSMAWYRFTGVAHNLVHVPQIIFGVALGLLGLLDIGPKKFNIADIDGDNNFVTQVNPLYRVVFDEAPLIIVAVVYLVVWLITALGLWWVGRRERATVQAIAENRRAEAGVAGGSGARDGSREKSGS